VNAPPPRFLRAIAAFDRVAQWWAQTPRPLRWASVFGILALIWWSSSRVPVQGLPGIGGELVHNGMHLVAFGSLAVAAWFAGRDANSVRDGRAAARLALAIAIVYGIIDEVHQSFVPGRTSSVFDVVTDACGACFCVWFLRIRAREISWSVWHGAGLGAASLASVVLATLA
jgi:VanZ family protein